MKWRAHLFMVQHSSAPGPKRNRGPLANSARAAKNVIYASVCMGRKKQPSLPKPINPSKRLPHRAPVRCVFWFQISPARAGRTLLFSKKFANQIPPTGHRALVHIKLCASIKKEKSTIEPAKRLGALGDLPFRAPVWWYSLL